MHKYPVALLILFALFSCSSHESNTGQRKKEKRAWISSLESENIYGNVWKIEETSAFELSSGPHFNRFHFDENGMLYKLTTHNRTTDSSHRFYTSDSQNHFLSLKYYENGKEIIQTTEYDNHYSHAYIFFSNLKSPLFEVEFDEKGRTKYFYHLHSDKTRMDSTVFEYLNGLKISEKTYIHDSLRLLIEYKYDNDGHLIDQHWLQYTRPLEDRHTRYVYQKDSKRNWIKRGKLAGNDTVNFVYRTIYYRPD